MKGALYTRTPPQQVLQRDSQECTRTPPCHRDADTSAMSPWGGPEPSLRLCALEMLSFAMIPSQSSERKHMTDRGPAPFTSGPQVPRRQLGLCTG